VSEWLLKMEGISKSFPGVQALSNACLDLRAGEVHALLGENGAGKSTLMKILTGVHKKDGGRIWIRGKEVEIESPKHAQRLGISIIYQEFNLLPHLTVAQNIFIGREPKGMFGWIVDDSVLRRQAEEILRSLRLDIDGDARVSSLSVAQQQMVEIAKALSLQSEIVVMDEPTAALTESEIDELFRVIADLKRKNVGIIYISHRLEELERIADRITVMRDGQYIGTKPYREVEMDEMIGMMVGRQLTEKFPERHASIGPVRLEVKNLCRDGVLHDVSFSVRAGEILGVAGLMGAGRTELARAIFGADPITSGEVWVDGRRADIRSPVQAIRLGIGYLTEDRKRDGLLLDKSVEDNVVMASIRDFANAVQVMEQDKCQAAAGRYVEELGIKTPGVKQKVKHLSGGNQQKVIIARWLCKRAHILIFDEPTRGIDVGAKYEVYSLMNRLAESGAAIVMISSELPEVLGMSDRILVMHQGKAAAILNREDATQERILYYATGGKKEG
jgi:ribose transport system ATP-binding protein